MKKAGKDKKFIGKGPTFEVFDQGVRDRTLTRYLELAGRKGWGGMQTDTAM